MVQYNPMIQICHLPQQRGDNPGCRHGSGYV